VQSRIFIVSTSVLPTTKYNADPFESQGPHGLMVGIAFTALLLVVRSRPLRLGDRMTRPFMKAFCRMDSMMTLPLESITATEIVA
jgi:hypothetical protein